MSHMPVQVRGRNDAEEHLSLDEVAETEEAFFRQYLGSSARNCQTGLRALTKMLLDLQAEELCKAAPEYLNLVGPKFTMEALCQRS